MVTTPFTMQGLYAVPPGRHYERPYFSSRLVSYIRGQKNGLPTCCAALQDTVKHHRHEQPQRRGTLADFGTQDCPLKTIEIELGKLLRIEVRPQFAHRLGLPKQARIALPPVGEHGFQLGAEE